MRKYFNPEMNIASFDKEAVATTASEALVTWAAQGDGTTPRYTATVDFSQLGAVDVQF